MLFCLYSVYRPSIMFLYVTYTCKNLRNILTYCQPLTVLLLVISHRPALKRIMYVILKLKTHTFQFTCLYIHYTESVTCNIYTCTCIFIE